MKYLSSILILLSAIVTLFANSGFVNHNSPQILKSIIGFFLSSFYEESTANSLSINPLYLISQNSTNIIIGLGILLCVVAGVIELINTIKNGRNSKSASIVALSVCFLYFNIKILIWNA